MCRRERTWGVRVSCSKLLRPATLHYWRRSSLVSSSGCQEAAGERKGEEGQIRGRREGRVKGNERRWERICFCRID